jgi:hypothetical protein
MQREFFTWLCSRDTGSDPHDVPCVPENAQWNPLLSIVARVHGKKIRENAMGAS